LGFSTDFEAGFFSSSRSSISLIFYLVSLALLLDELLLLSLFSIFTGVTTFAYED
jgi:hypothetical protein